MSEHDIAARFARETADHEMTVLHDDGLYRHLRFRKPNHGSYWFDLITVPHALIFRGDGESFVFSRLTDMFEFFRSGIWEDGSLNISPSYWAEKLTSDRDSVMKYDEELFKQRVIEAFVEAVEDRVAPRGLGMAVREEILNSEFLASEDEARRVLDDFEFCTYTATCECGTVETFTDLFAARQPRPGHALHHTSVERGESFTFDDTSEWSFQDYYWWFLWALHGIVWGIAQYDAKKAAEQPEAVGAR